MHFNLFLETPKPKYEPLITHNGGALSSKAMMWNKSIKQHHVNNNVIIQINEMINSRLTICKYIK